ncbi:hypothetical protein PUR71_24705 [Streptomyces sp. SP17BM10]|uniref:hypothetical protein n=1 Tax=Streptomyces sp. SP17BM10 TaxID=3002530 RepID=UPI002E792476|nr:hypothetical protein [Streptomyces sp. SP17BM10]MEE1786073.1 hypothetical protein [Streptomyces sp. SP17BM10]
MGAYVLDDSTCKSEILFMGNTGLKPWAQSTAPPAGVTAEMFIDVIGPTTYATTDFENVTLTLEITSPPGALFVRNPKMGSVLWGVPKADGTWDESNSDQPTARLRLRQPDKTHIVSTHPTDGLTFWLAVSGLPDETALSFHAYATADRLLATTTGCPMQMKDLAVGETVTGRFFDPSNPA